MPREPIDRVLDVAVGLPIVSARFAHDAARLAVRTAVGIVGVAAGQLATAAVDALTLTAELSPEPLEPFSDTKPFASVAPVDADQRRPATADTIAATSVDDLPIDGYRHLSARQIIGLLADLSTDELDAVARFERAHRSRQTILQTVASLSAGV